METASDPRIYDPACRRCERLVEFLDTVRARYPAYHAAPVPPFGDAAARLLVIGLAPGMHGANATGRPFTGDHAGILLYRTLHRFGFADRAESQHAADGLTLHDCRITNAVKCLPPQNKPRPDEVARCRDYLVAELDGMPEGGVLIALGRIAHETVLRALGLPLKTHAFAHAAEHGLAQAGLTLLDSYHCSRYNTQTGRLTTPMFEAVFARARALLGPRA
ncbi:MAG: uracil-DNA glycosylase [Gammaproteobacteria bacterium]